MRHIHKMQSRLTLLIGMTTVFVAGLLTSQYLYTPDPVTEMSTAPTSVATVLAPPRVLPDFQLIDQSDRAMTKQDLAGQWTLVFMGFTNCGHVCPTTLFTLSEAVQQLSVPPRVLFVSVDPGRDSPDVIQTYVQGFGEDFAGATGTEEQLREFAGSLGAPFYVQKDDDRYIVDHSNAVFLLDPATQFHALFSAPHDADVIAEDLARIMRAHTAATATGGRRL